ncbi:IS1096 element passenger TnpR family protein [Lapillicoccus sp.]|uniref:IS1096 element passenger TnpR family protein n=1 Tax=Lapillicoccus sp. TaxID=1909287 RepID=UPI00387E6AB6
MVMIELRGSRPGIWRRLTLPGDLTPNSVHTLFQTAVGWTDSHMHECLAKLRPRLLVSRGRRWRTQRPARWPRRRGRPARGR